MGSFSLFQISGNHWRISWLFLRILALIYFAAFYSLAGQIAGLAGPEGILPFSETLTAIRQHQGDLAWLQLPTLFWLDSSNSALTTAAWLGCGLSLALLLGMAQRLCLILLFTLYLSLFHAGQLFLNFQWDYLLLETGFLAIFLVSGPSRLVIFLFHFLLFRLRFLSGLSKLLSGDPSWQELTALNHYFQTQPLPHIGSWYAQQLPDWLLRGATGTTLFMELVVPFFIFLPRPFRIFAALSTILLQLLIIATSNHNFFNLLTIALCLFLLDDRFFGPHIWGRSQIGLVLPNRNSLRDLTPTPELKGKSFPLAMGLLAIVVITAGSLSAYRMASTQPLPETLERSLYLVQQYGIGSAYHVFPVMQTERHELEIQGSLDGRQWQSYRFNYKPGPLNRSPPIVIPHQPRLDWMMWFVPTQAGEMRYWFDLFMRKLWQNQSAVTDLLAHNPFAAEPPRYLRVLVHRYRFTSSWERSETGNWWVREYIGEFPQLPPRRP